MHMMRRLLGVVSAPLAAVLLASCGDQQPTTPLAPDTAWLTSSPSSTLLECESTVAATPDTELIDPLVGGSLQVVDHVGGVHEVTFPAGAVTVPTEFTLEVPASKYVEVRVTATDPVTGAVVDAVFPADAQPTLAVSFKRCTRSNVQKADLRLYNIDENTNAVLEGPFGGKEGGTTDPRVVGAVPHFSDYAIGTPN